MCGRYSIVSASADLEVKWYPSKMPTLAPMQHYNASPTQLLPIFSEEKGLSLVQWGITPSWCPHIIINAKYETLFEKPFFENAIPCLIPVTSFFEWSGKQPYRIIPDQEPFSVLAGIILNNSFLIVTTAATEQIQFIHHRMPLFLTSAQENIWLSENRKNQTKNLIQATNRNFQVIPVSHYVSSARNEGPRCWEPFQAASLF